MENTKIVQDRTRSNIANVVHNYINGFNSTRHSESSSKILAQARYVTSKFLKSNEDICVLPADKGNRTVVMLVEDYERKMNLLLSDTTTYTPIKSDPTHKFQTTNNNIVKRLKDLKLIDDRTAARLRTYTATCPRIYGQPKAHKTDLPLRPVVPGMTAPSYQLSKYICSILQASIDSKYNIKDSISFARYINTTTIPPDHMMVSFDVVALFTNIPRGLVAHDIIYHWDAISPHTQINLDLFLEIVDFCMDASYFVFRNQHYLQVEGTAMGNPASPVLADFTLEVLINTVIHQISCPITVHKYVDDLFLIVPKNKLEEVLAAFNSYHSRIQFTHEEEREGRLPYLDMTLVRQADNSIRTEWYIKDIASGRLLNFHSIHPLSQKINMASNFIDRVQKLTTNQTTAEINKTITKYLTLNDYPRSLINRCLNCKTQNKPSSQIHLSTSPTNTTEKIYRSIPYIPGLTPRITQLLRHECPNVVVTSRSTYTVSSLYTRIKDVVHPLNQHNIIYCVNCNNCDNKYIGMTSNLLKTRLSGHRSDVNRLDKLLQSGHSYSDVEVQATREKTALISHCIDTGHRFDLTQAEILDQTFKRSSLSLLEMIWIHNTQDTVNKRTDTDGLNSTYAGILHALHKHREKNPKQNNTNTQ